MLPGDFKIKPTKMRGVESNGMLCSGKELGVPDDADGLLLLPADAPVGQSIRDYLGLDDQLFTLKITPNRADCLSIRGIAREVAALTGAELAPVAIPAVAPQIDDALAVAIAATPACGRYLGRVVKGVNAAAATPEWMRRRLERAGLRSISAVVDITNYVLLEQGQPMHAFDLAAGRRHRRAHGQDGEELLCLNEKTVKLNAGHMVIADQTKALALAGIMGGEHSGVTVASSDIFLEARSSRRKRLPARRANSALVRFLLPLRTRRGLPATARSDGARNRSGAGDLRRSAGSYRRGTAELPRRGEVKLRVSRCAKLLGVTLSSEQIGDILSRLGLTHSLDGDVFTVAAPSFRFDIAIEEDLIEEVARVYGYDAIPSDAPRSGMRMLAQREELRPRDQIRHLLAARDYQEIVSYAFVDEAWERDFAANEQPVRLINPIASQMSVMRSTLIGGLVDVLVGNINRKQPRVRCSKWRACSRNPPTGSISRKSGWPGLGPRLPEQWGVKAERVDFFDAKADVEALLHPQQASFRKAEHPAFHPGVAPKCW